MSTSSPQTTVIVVDSVLTLLSLLNTISSLAVQSLLYIDLGINLGRNGSISIISIHIPSTEKTYLIDVYRLGEAAFSTVNRNATSLKTILESPTITKVIFDVRNDSDALFSLYQISVDSIKDLQLMELATRQGSLKFVSGLAKCIELDSVISNARKAEWLRTKETGRNLFAPEKGGRYEAFNERPMRPEIMEYCSQDVALLPGLYDLYDSVLSREGFWQAEVRKATKDRIILSQSPNYDGNLRNMTYGPWSQNYINQAAEAWNIDAYRDECYSDAAQDCDG